MYTDHHSLKNRISNHKAFKNVSFFAVMFHVVFLFEFQFPLIKYTNNKKYTIPFLKNSKFYAYRTNGPVSPIRHMNPFPPIYFRKR